MKHLAILLASCLLALTSFSAALPEEWDVDLAAQPPQVFTLQRPRGESYELAARLNIHGKPFAPAITNACIYWQTNGMENLYWSAPASVSNNVLRATWLPSMDPGATTVRGFIGDPGHIYAAAFQFRFTASPGPLPNELPLPTPVIDFSRVTVLNPPWSGGGSGGVDTNAVRDIVQPMLDEAIEANEKTGTNQQIVRGNLTNTRWSIDVESSHIADTAEYANYIRVGYWTDDADATGKPTTISGYGITDGATKTELAVKRDLTNNVCTASSFGPWDYSGGPSGIVFTGQPSYDITREKGAWIWFDSLGREWWMLGTTESSRLVLYCSDDQSLPAVTISRLAIATSGQPFVTKDYVDNHVSPPSPTLRVYDDVQSCWWIGRMVNGVMSWEVE